MRIFKTIKPKNKFLRKYISYYYLDIADGDDYFNEYICYPHFNNTISLYKSHNVDFKNGHSTVYFKRNGLPLQVFTPLREKILKITQKGPIHKIAVVFEPFGINHFLARQIEINKTASSPSFNFFGNEFVLKLFNEDSIENIGDILEEELLKKLIPIKNPYIEKAIQIFHTSANEFSIDELAEVKLGISRKHLNRLFQKHIGTTPQKYRAILRFRQLMDYKLQSVHYHNYTTLSHKVQYTDQSHFIKACKQFTGLTPSQFFKEGKIVGSEDTFWNFNI